MTQKIVVLTSGTSWSDPGDTASGAFGGTTVTLTTVTLTAGTTTWTVPSDWSSTNTIQVWAAGGGGGGNYGSDPYSAEGGAGGGYSDETDYAGWTAGDVVDCSIPSGGDAGYGGGQTGHASSDDGGSPGPCWIGGTSLATSIVGANSGAGGWSAAHNRTGGSPGGSTTGAVGTTKHAGGNGGSNADGQPSNAGGGGAAGPDGDGQPGTGTNDSGGTVQTGGNGDNNSGGIGGKAASSTVAAQPGANNALGGGGGGGTSSGAYNVPSLPGSTAATGGAGGFPGGGGGSAGAGGTTNGGPGGDAVIVIKYTPLVVPILSNPTPSGTVSGTTQPIGCTTDTSSGTLYVVLDTGAHITGVTVAQVKAGQNNTGSSAAFSGNSAVSTTSPSVSISGLTAGTSYAFAIVQVVSGVNSDVLLGAFTTSAGTYTLSVSNGSYALTAAAATLIEALSLAAVSGSYALSGESATLTQAYVTTATAGNYALTGENATLLFSAGASMVAATGTYSITGESATLTEAMSFAAATGAYASSGQNANLSYLATYTLAAAGGSYVLTGESANFNVALSMAATTGQYSLGGDAAALVAIDPFPVSAGTYTITGVAVNFVLNTQYVSLADAIRICVNAGFYVEQPIIIATDPAVPAGYIIGQLPVPGVTVPYGAAVTLTVSVGPAYTVPNSMVPAVVGLGFLDAQLALSQAGLALPPGAITWQFSTTVPDTYIISQSIASGTSVPPQSAIHLVVSMGPAQNYPAQGTLDVPNVT